jgi:PAB-dependent poly(A)-specific ribonuclease subunit 2
MYRFTEIEYSRFGVEDFDFNFYNKTDYPGLENHILHCYTNPLVQVLHYCEPVRNVAKGHVAASGVGANGSGSTECVREHCLLCEMGFVVRMLEDATEGRTPNCHATNFCKTVGVLAQAANKLELIDYGLNSSTSGPSGQGQEYVYTIQTFHRFLLDRFSEEGNSFPLNPILTNRPGFEASQSNPAAAPITQLLGINAKTVIECGGCGFRREKESMGHLVECQYGKGRWGSSSSSGFLSSLSGGAGASASSLGATAAGGAAGQEQQTFASVLRESLLHQMSYRASCQACKQFSNMSTRRSIATRDLPPILAVNAGAPTEESIRLWIDGPKGETFLKTRVEVRGEVGGVEDPEVAVYNLRVCLSLFGCIF